MAKRVVVVASGETERRALPHLLAHLEKDGFATFIKAVVNGVGGST